MEEESGVRHVGIERLLARFLPAGIATAHELLYDFDRRHHFVPSEGELRACLEAYASLLANLTEKDPLGVLRALEASELALAYVARADAHAPARVAAAASMETEGKLRRARDGIESFLDGR